MTELLLTDKNFHKEVLESELPVTVEFFTDRHGSSHIIGSTMKEMVERFSGQVKFCKINVDEQMKTAQEYGVLDIPTILFLKNGKIVDHIIGMAPKATIANKLNSLIESE